MQTTNHTPQPGGEAPNKAAETSEVATTAAASAAPMPAAPELPEVVAPSIMAAASAGPAPAQSEAALSNAPPSAPPPAAESKGPPSARPGSPIGATPPLFARDQATKPGPRPAARPVPPSAARPAAAKTRIPQVSRFALLAASVAVAACAGAIIGSIMILASGRLSAASDNTAELQSLKAAVAQLGADLGAMKAGQDQSLKAANAQFGRIAERLERVERQQAEPAAKLTKALESLDRLERRAATAPAAPAVGQNDVTGSTPARAATPPKPPVLEGWILRRVYDGVALVQGRRGVVEVEAGDSLSGAGRIREIKREDGRWIVVTSRGVIVPAR